MYKIVIFFFIEWYFRLIEFEEIKRCFVGYQPISHGAICRFHYEASGLFPFLQFSHISLKHGVLGREYPRLGYKCEIIWVVLGHPE